jgi:hypothetical protein
LKLYYLNKTEVLKTNPLPGIQKFKIPSIHQVPVLYNSFHYSSFTFTQANYFYPCILSLGDSLGIWILHANVSEHCSIFIGGARRRVFILLQKVNETSDNKSMRQFVMSRACQDVRCWVFRSSGLRHTVTSQ